MDTDNPGDFWSQFTLVVSVMRELGVLSFFMEHSVGSVVRDEVGGESQISIESQVCFWLSTSLIPGPTFSNRIVGKNLPVTEASWSRNIW